MLVGYDDQGQVVGILNVQKMLEDIPNEVRDAQGIVIDVNLQLHGALGDPANPGASLPLSSQLQG